jgi:spermidine synthase
MIRNAVPYTLMFLSGLAGLGYEIVWTCMLSATLGHEIIAVLAVVSAFFSGLALGSWTLDRPISAAKNPGRWYAGLEFSIGLREEGGPGPSAQP